jgi:hypothetical protein
MFFVRTITADNSFKTEIDRNSTQIKFSPYSEVSFYPLTYIKTSRFMLHTEMIATHTYTHTHTLCVYSVMHHVVHVDTLRDLGEPCLRSLTA